MEATHIKVKTCRIISWMFLRTKKWCSVKWAAYCLFRGVTVLKSQCVWVTWHNKLEWRHLPNIVQFPFVQPKWLWHFEAWTPGLSWCSVLIMLWSLWSCGLDCWSLSGFGLFLQRATAWLDWNLGCLEAWLTLCQVHWAVLEKFSQPTGNTVMSLLRKAVVLCSLNHMIIHQTSVTSPENEDACYFPWALLFWIER